MKSDRLLATLLLLQTHRRLSASDLAARLEVSTRTVMRDVEALGAAGVPVYTDRGRNGGISILPDFTTDVTGMTGEEAKALFVLLTSRAHEDLGLGTAMASALRKVMAALPPSHRDDAVSLSRRVILDPVRWGREKGSDQHAVEIFSALQRAVFDDRRLAIRYRARIDAGSSSYTVDPYGLVDKAGVWYLVADHRASPRLFRADRILSTRVDDRPAKRRSGVELSTLWTQLRNEANSLRHHMPVHVRVRQTSLGRFLRVHGDDVVGDLPSELSVVDESRSVDLTVRVQSVGASQVFLAFGPEVEVVAPEEVRKHLYSVVAELAMTYPPSQQTHGGSAI